MSVYAAPKPHGQSNILCCPLLWIRAGLRLPPYSGCCLVLFSHSLQKAKEEKEYRSTELLWFWGKTLISSKDRDWSGSLVNCCSGKSIQKQIQLQKSTIPDCQERVINHANESNSSKDLWTTCGRQTSCPQSCLRNIGHSGNLVKAELKRQSRSGTGESPYCCRDLWREENPALGQKRTSRRAGWKGERI